MATLFEKLQQTKPKTAEFKADAGEVKALDFRQFSNSVPVAESSDLDEISAFVADEPSPAQPQVDVEAIRAEAYEAGQADKAAEMEVVLAGLEESIEMVALNMLQEVERFRSSIAEQSRDAVLELSRAFAEAILDRQLEMPEAVVDVTRSAIARACGLDKIHVYVTPASVEILENHLRYLRPEDPTGDSITIHSDDTMSRGDIRITSEGGQIQGIIADRLDRLVDSAFSNISDIFEPTDGESESHSEPFSSTSGLGGLSTADDPFEDKL